MFNRKISKDNVWKHLAIQGKTEDYNGLGIDIGNNSDEGEHNIK